MIRRTLMIGDGDMNYHEAERLKGDLDTFVITLVEERKKIDAVNFRMRRLMEVIEGYQPFNTRSEYQEELFALAGYNNELAELLRSYMGHLDEYRRMMQRYAELLQS